MMEPVLFVVLNEVATRLHKMEGYAGFHTLLTDIKNPFVSARTCIAPRLTAYCHGVNSVKVPFEPEFGIRLSLLYRNESYFHGRDDSVHSQIAMNNIYSCKEYFCLF